MDIPKTMSSLASISHILPIVSLLLFLPPTLASASPTCAAPPRDSAACPADPVLKQGRPSLLFIANGTVVNADHQRLSHVLIENGVIFAVGPELKPPEGARVLDAAGKFVMPGGIDPHTHLDMPFMGQVACDDFYSGHAAALAGGTTMHIDFALPVGGDLIKGYEEWRRKGCKAAMDYGLHMAVTSWSDKVAADMTTLVSHHGINSFKFFMAYKGALMVTDYELLQGMLKCKSLGALPQVHAENGDAVAYGQQHIFEQGITGPEGHVLSRPAVLEGEATARAIRLARFVNAPLYVVHVMSKEALGEVARARVAGQREVGEPVASGLAFNGTQVFHPDFRYAAQFIMSPPIRGAEDAEALKSALSTGVLQLVGTDHAVFNASQKEIGRNDFRVIPNGVNGIEERMHIVWDLMVNSGLISPSRYVSITSAECAKIFNVYPRKGAIAPGSDADVIILNPDVTHTISTATHHSRMDTNIYEGWEVKGKVEVTISRGKVVWEGGKLTAEEGAGQFVEMPPFGPLFDGLDKQDELFKAASGAPVRRD